MTCSKPSKKYKRLSLEEWAQAETFWKTGAHTLEELSASFGVTTRTLQAHFRKHGVVKSSEAGMIAAAAQEQVRGKEIGDLARRMELARQSQATTFENADRLESLIMAQIALSEREPDKAFVCMGAVKMLSLAASTIERLASVKGRALNVPVDDPEELPVIRFFDLAEEDLEAIRRRQASGEEEEEYLADAEREDDRSEEDADPVIET